jgi:hypothetical protein
MKCKLKKITHLSGNKASIYSVVMDGDTKTLYEIFLSENYNSFLSEITHINKRLQIIGTKTGAIDDFFKLYEGKYGDGVCALYDLPKFKLRLYCIKYGTQIIILGGGGAKSKKTKALQDDPKLKSENYFLRWLSEQITVRLQSDIHISDDGLDLLGDLEFEDE